VANTAAVEVWMSPIEYEVALSRWAAAEAVMLTEVAPVGMGKVMATRPFCQYASPTVPSKKMRRARDVSSASIGRVSAKG